MTKNTKVKVKKLESIPKINRRLFKLWSEQVRKRSNNCCEYCNRKVGETDKEDKILRKIDAHHLQSRKVKDNPLKFDILNAVAVCPLHHKFSCNESFHRAPVITINWLIKKFPERFEHVLINYNNNVDLQNREVLKEIEKCLNECQKLDINKLKEIERNNPRQITSKKVKYVGTLDENDEEESSEDIEESSDKIED